MRKKTASRKKPAKINFIPSGYHTVTPYLACGDAAAAIEFYKKAFGATEVMRMPAAGGKIGHAEVRIGNSRIMLTDKYGEMNFLSPRSRGGTTVHIHLYVKNCDAIIKNAVGAGAKLLQPVEDKFYGDRTGSTHKEDLSWRRCASAVRRR